MEVASKKESNAKLTGKKYKHLKLNMTQHGLNVDAFDAMAVAYTDEQRETHRVVANARGHCVDTALGKVLNFGPLAGQYEAGKEGVSSKFIWAMDDSGNLYVDLSQNSAGIFHSTMMGGYRPIAAGEICIENGFIVMLNEESGHYAPKDRLALVIDELKLQGFRFADITLINSTYDAVVKRVDKLDVRKHLIKRNQLASGLKKEKWINK